MPNSDSSCIFMHQQKSWFARPDKVHPVFNCPVVVNLYPELHISVLSCQEIWRGLHAVGVRPPHGMLFIQRCFSACHSCKQLLSELPWLRSISLCFNQSGRFLLTSLINKAFLSSQPQLNWWVFFSVFSLAQFCVETPETVVVSGEKKNPADQQFQKYSIPSPSGTNSPATVKVS